MKVSERIKGLAKRKIRPPAIWSCLRECSDEVEQLEDEIDRLYERSEDWQEFADTLIDESDQRPSVKVSDGDVWLVFNDAMISIEGLCKSGTPGPIVRRSLRRWRDDILASRP